MRIGIDARPLVRPRIGAGTYVYYLVKELAKIDTKNTYLLCAHRKIIDSPVVTTPNFQFQINSYPVGSLWQQLKLPRILTRLKVDLFHSPLSVLPLLKPCPSVVTVLDLTPKLFPSRYTWKTHLSVHTLLRQSAQRADKVIAISESTKRDLVEHLKVNESKIVVIHLAADKAYYRSTNPGMINTTRKKYSEGKKFILYVGTLEPRKNLPRLIKAYNKVRLETRLKHKLVIAGMKGWMYDSIFQTVHNLNLEKDVIFTGYVPQEELPALYSAADLFVYPSLYEGFGLPPLEAMACGTPVITSNTSSLPEVVGDAGTMVNPHSVDELAQAIYKVLTDEKLRSDMIYKGLKQAKKFTWEKTAQETLKV